MKKYKVVTEGNIEEWFYKKELVKKIVYYSNGQKESERYYKNDYLHRDGDNPAYISWAENGNNITKVYYKDGEYHRDGNKPAVIHWFRSGLKMTEKYYNNGVEYTPTKEEKNIMIDGKEFSE